MGVAVKSQRKVVAVASLFVVLSGCSGGNEKERPSPSAASEAIRPSPTPSPSPFVEPKAGATRSVDSDDKFAIIRNRLTGHEGSVTGLAFLPDARRLLSVSTDRTVRLWDLTAGKELKQFRSPDGGHLTCIALSGDGKKAVVGGYQVLFVLDVDSWKILHRLEYKKGMGGLDVRAVAIAPDSGRFLVGGAMICDLLVYDEKGNYLPGVTSAPHFLLLLDLASGKVVERFKKDFLDHCKALAFLEDGKKALVTSTGRQAIDLFDLQTGKSVRSFEHSGIGRSAAFSLSPKKDLLLTPKDEKDKGAMLLYDVASGTRKNEFILPPSLTFPNVNDFDNVCFTPNGKHALFAGRYRDEPGQPKQYAVVMVWDIANWREVERFRLPDESILGSLACSPDGRAAVIGSGTRGTIEVVPLPK